MQGSRGEIPRHRSRGGHVLGMLRERGHDSRMAENRERGACCQFCLRTDYITKEGQDREKDSGLEGQKSTPGRFSGGPGEGTHRECPTEDIHSVGQGSEIISRWGQSEQVSRKRICDTGILRSEKVPALQKGSRSMPMPVYNLGS